MNEHERPDDSDELDDELEETPFSPKELALYAVRAVRQNLVLSLLIASAISFAGGAVVAALPSVYDATSKIFIEEGGGVTTALASGHDRRRELQGARGLNEYIFAHDNLLSIVREAGLVEEWPKTRVLPMRLKDSLMESLRGAPSREDQELGFVEMLTKSITAMMEGESVRIHATWRTAQSAYDIARLVQRNFLAARTAHDIGPIQRAIPFLETQLARADQELEEAATQLHTLKASRSPTDTSSAAPKRRDEGALIAAARLSRRLSEARRRQRTLSNEWHRRTTELKTRLVDVKAQFSPQHPKVLQLEARLEAASEIPDDLEDLRQEETELLDSISNRSKTRSRRGTSNSSAKREGRSTIPAPEFDPAEARLVTALQRSDEFAERLDDARIELATAEIDFQHRYVVIEQPKIPRQPIKRKKPLLFGLVFLVALALGAVGGIARQIFKGRLEEPWQARMLGVPMLAEVQLKELPPPRNS